MEAKRTMEGLRSVLDVLGLDLVEAQVLPRMDSATLARAGRACKALGPCVKRVAKRAVLEANGGSEQDASRWR